MSSAWASAADGSTRKNARTAGSCSCDAIQIRPGELYRGDFARGELMDQLGSSAVDHDRKFSVFSSELSVVRPLQRISRELKTKN